MNFDAFLLVSYGGPERPEEVVPFLNRILDGKHVPESRRKAVLDKYLARGGYSPLNDQCRRFIARMKEAIGNEPVRLYHANLYSEPLVPRVVERMRADGVRRVLMLISSPFGMVAGCRRYLDAVRRYWPEEVELTVIPDFFDHPLYLKAAVNRLLTCCANAILDTDSNSVSHSQGVDMPETLFLFTAHALPVHEVQSTRYREELIFHYEEVLRESQVLSARELLPAIVRLAFQSRSGGREEEWMGPDIRKVIESTLDEYPSLLRVIVTPSGFFFENMEIIGDLDTDIRLLCGDCGVGYYRTETAGTSYESIQMCTEYLSMARTSFSPCACSLENCNYSCIIPEKTS